MPCRCRRIGLEKGTRRQQIPVRRIVRLEFATARINACVIDLTAFRCLDLDLGWTTVVALFDDLEGHGARHKGKIQANREQKDANPASAECSPVLCESLNHSAFLDVWSSKCKEIGPNKGKSGRFAVPVPTGHGQRQDAVANLLAEYKTCIGANRRNAFVELEAAFCIPPQHVQLLQHLDEIVKQ